MLRAGVSFKLDALSVFTMYWFHRDISQCQEAVQRHLLREEDQCEDAKRVPVEMRIECASYFSSDGFSNRRVEIAFQCAYVSCRNVGTVLFPCIMIGGAPCFKMMEEAKLPVRALLHEHELNWEMTSGHSKGPTVEEARRERNMVLVNRNNIVIET